MYAIATLPHDNPKLNQLRIQNDALNFQASIYPNLGASLQEFRMEGVDLIEGITPDESGLTDYKLRFQSSLLFPFFGRIPGGKYFHEGTWFQLNCNGDSGSTAIHGHVYDQSFALLESSITDNSAELTFEYNHDGTMPGYPFPYTMTLQYRFSENRLITAVRIENTGYKTLPFGLGWHPYFRSADLQSAVLYFQADSQLLLNEKLVPEGIGTVSLPSPIVLSDQELDYGFLMGTSQFTLNTKEYNVHASYSSESPNSYMQVYTPPNRSSVAVEPLTCAPNCFNNGLGLEFLDPGKSFDWSVDLQAELT
jgi:aldose 1-epimerase